MKRLNRHLQNYRSAESAKMEIPTSLHRLIEEDVGLLQHGKNALCYYFVERIRQGSSCIKSRPNTCCII